MKRKFSCENPFEIHQGGGIAELGGQMWAERKPSLHQKKFDLPN
jgi:hypothetical protein